MKPIRAKFYDWMPRQGGWECIHKGEYAIQPTPQETPPKVITRSELNWDAQPEEYGPIVRNVDYQLAGKVEDWGSENPVYAYHRIY